MISADAWSRVSGNSGSQGMHREQDLNLDPRFHPVHHLRVAGLACHRGRDHGDDQFDTGCTLADAIRAANANAARGDCPAGSGPTPYESPRR